MALRLGGKTAKYLTDEELRDVIAKGVRRYDEYLALDDPDEIDLRDVQNNPSLRRARSQRDYPACSSQSTGSSV